jgi:putative sigma-54 modulation protein
MNIAIKGTGMELTPSIREYVEKKISRISRLGRDNDFCSVEVGKITAHHNSGEVFRAEIELMHYGKNIRIEETGTDLYAAIDLAGDRLFREVTSAKGKDEALFRRGARRLKGVVRRFYR